MHSDVIVPLQKVPPSAPGLYPDLGSQVAPSDDSSLPRFAPSDKTLPTFARTDFHLQKADDVLNFLNSEVSHYRLVAKKYKRLKNVVNFCGFTTGGISGFLSAGGVIAASSGVGAVAALPIGSVAAVFGLAAAGLAGCSRKVEPKVSKHCRIVTLALAKADTVNRILSKALVDNVISDSEFQAVLDEKERYLLQKEVIRKGSVPPSDVGKKLAPVDIDVNQIKIDAAREERARLQKKLMASAGDLSS